MQMGKTPKRAACAAVWASELTGDLAAYTAITCKACQYGYYVKWGMIPQPLRMATLIAAERLSFELGKQMAYGRAGFAEFGDEAGDSSMDITEIERVKLVMQGVVFRNDFK
jgi:hypothetical protein